MNMALCVRSLGGPHNVSLARIRTRGKRMLAALDRADAEVTVVLSDDITIQQLNRDYRQIDAPTDVLAFAMTEGEFGDVQPSILGDVVVSVPTARRQAEEGHREELDEITWLMAHGLLHLVGFDHRTKRQETVMTRETKRLVDAATTGKTTNPV